MDQHNVDALPEELLVNIFRYLDSKPPSQVNIRKEPSLDLIQSKTRSLKDVSCVSKRWRRIVLPLLFRDARLRVDAPAREEWSNCPACGNSADPDHDMNASVVDAVHFDMVKAFESRYTTPRAIYDPKVTPFRILKSASTTRESFEQPDEESTAAWAWHLYHIGEDFFDFIGRENLASSIRSFMLLTGRMLKGKLGRFPHQTAPKEWRYPAAAVFWEKLLSLFDPVRVVVLAPPMEMACLTNAAIDTFGDWAFGDMDYHILELQQDNEGHPRTTSRSKYTDLRPVPFQYPSFALSSLMNIRRWTHLTLNEGSFLKAYGTYEYFERGPPSLVYSIKHCLAPTQSHPHAIGRQAYIPRSIRSFTYIAIFPFANHADFIWMLPYLEEVDLQFAPEPSSSILDDKSRIGKAELSDCWQEMFSSYNDVATALSTFRMTAKTFPRLKKLTCRDYQIPALDAELDEVFTPLCMPVWVERERGVFTREAMDYRIPGVDTG